MNPKFIDALGHILQSVTSPLADPNWLPGPRVLQLKYILNSSLQFDSCHFSGAQQILLSFGFSLYTSQTLAISFSCFKLLLYWPLKIHCLLTSTGYHHQSTIMTKKMINFIVYFPFKCLRFSNYTQ